MPGDWHELQCVDAVENSINQSQAVIPSRIKDRRHWWMFVPTTDFAIGAVSRRLVRFVKIEHRECLTGCIYFSEHEGPRTRWVGRQHIQYHETVALAIADALLSGNLRWRLPKEGKVYLLHAPESCTDSILNLRAIPNTRIAHFRRSLQAAVVDFPAPVVGHVRLDPENLPA